ncbi:MAG: hypothetical protein WA825_08825 [Steroidobacteraceae bacterium]
MSAHTRREFLGGVGMSVAAVVALRLAPGARALPLQWGAPQLPPALAAMYPQGDWHVDDIVGHLPRYAHPIPYMHDTTPPDFSACMAPVDRQFVS